MWLCHLILWSRWRWHEQLNIGETSNWELKMCFKISHWLFQYWPCLFCCCGTDPRRREGSRWQKRTWSNRCPQLGSSQSKRRNQQLLRTLQEGFSMYTLEFLDSLYQSFFCWCSWVWTLEPKKGIWMGEAVFSKQRVLDSVLHLSWEARRPERPPAGPSPSPVGVILYDGILSALLSDVRAEILH